MMTDLFDKMISRVNHLSKKYGSFLLALAASSSLNGAQNYSDPHPFGTETEFALDADNLAIGKWWEVDPKTVGRRSGNARAKGGWFKTVARNQALAFSLYTHDHDVLKLSAQCFPLLPSEPKSITLSFKRDGEWVIEQSQPVIYPGWSAHFRVEDWDNSEDVPYRLTLGELSAREGLIRRDPLHKDTIVVASLNCNSPRDEEFETRSQIVKNLEKQDPDLLFFAGDQNYTHDEATFGWLQFGVQFRDVMKNRPTICIPDDHDIGHGNLWGENGKRSMDTEGASDGGYLFPPSFVNMVERQQTWNLPDAYDPTPVQQGIGVYYTDINVGGISFAILEDRKFKSAPLGNIKQMGPRPDHIIDPSYDRQAVDLPGLTLLGQRQLNFLDHWARNWTGSVMKIALSQTAFAGGVHVHGNRKPMRLLADLDCNGWPQTPRNEALRALRRVRATHLCGDQHLGTVLQHGIDGFRDGPFSFTAPAIVNMAYGRWWHPEDEQSGGGALVGGPNPWVGDYEDGLGNRITMHAYANPGDRDDRKQRGDGYGIVRLHKPSRSQVLEAWPRFADVDAGDRVQYPGWPIHIDSSLNDGRQVYSYLKRVALPVENAVVELTNVETGELVYCFRVRGSTFKAPVYQEGKYTLKAGQDKATHVMLKGVTAPSSPSHRASAAN